MILIEFLFAPTVPSAPSPKKTARTDPAGSASNDSSTFSDSPVTSSTIPTVKCCLGAGRSSSSKTALTIAGVNSLEPSP
jgi:hypothetical protein